MMLKLNTPSRASNVADWQTTSSEVVYETPWIKVRRDEVLNQNGKPLTYSVVEARHPSVLIVAVNAEGNIMLQQSFRYTTQQLMWELPAGHSDGQDTLVAAKRELLEETGLQSNDWTNLGTFFQAVGIGNVQFQVFLARGVQSVSDERDDLEDIIKQQFMSFARIEEMIKDRTLQSSPAITAIYSAKLYGL
jgi:8-oxo-dGTP pyrophosphatase MutT (NUDIX family)